MAVRADDRWSYAGLPLIRVENERLTVDIVPALGGKILNLIDKRNDRNVLWRNPRVVPQRAPLHSNPDDYFSGGWDDAFPTGDASIDRQGNHLPTLGEVRTLALSSRIEEDGPHEARIVLDGYTPITTARWTRVITLREDEPILGLRTRIENVGDQSFDFNWGSHCALAVDHHFRIDVPARRGRIPDAGGEILGKEGQSYEYPVLRADPPVIHDVRQVLSPTAHAYALHILEGLTGGWIAATDTVGKHGFGIVFDPEVQQAVWQWMVYGGFRGWYHVILEPWISGHPSLVEAVNAGQARSLKVGQSLETEMWGVLYQGVTEVTGIDRDGKVTGLR